MISAIIVNYLSAEGALRAAASLRPPVQDEDVEIWMVDNSEDKAEASRLRTGLGTACRLLINERNLGFGAACNQAFDHSRGEWILLLNPDAFLEPTALACLLRFLKERPEAAAAGPLIYWDEGRRFLLPPSPPPGPWRELLTVPGGFLGARLAWLKSLWWRRESLRVWEASCPVRQRNLSGGHVLLRRSAVEKAGGLFDPRFFLYYEDTDLFLRLRRAGFYLYVVPEAAAIHAFGGCARDRAEWKQRLMEESHQRFVEKHFCRHPARLLIKGRRRPQGQAGWLPQTVDLGTIESPPILPVPSELREGWLLEWSPGPFFFPTAGHLGRGEAAEFPAEAWGLLPPGRQFVRLGGRKCVWVPPRVWQWNKT